MAELRFFENIFEDGYKTVSFDSSKSLMDQIAEFSFENEYESYLVECYDPEENKTFYAPLCDDENESIVISVNGNVVSEDFVPQEKDVINIIVYHDMLQS